MAIRIAVGGQPDAGRRRRVHPEPRGHRVHRVLQQLADVDARAGIEVLGQQVDQTAQVHLEGVGVSDRFFRHAEDRTGYAVGAGATLFDSDQSNVLSVLVVRVSLVSLT